MIPSAALPFTGAALRVMRTAAGRRALHLALLVGGLFALGLLCEGQAHAADGTPAASSAPATAGLPADSLRPADTVRPVENVVQRLQGVVGSTVARTVRTSSGPAAHRGHPTSPAGHTSQGRLASASSGRLAVTPSGPHAVRPGTTPVHRSSPSGTRSGSTAPAVPAADPVASLASLAKTLPAVGGTVRQVVRPVTEGLLRPVGGKVVGPVGGLVRTVTAALEGAPAQLPPLSTVPSVPELPGLPGIHGLPTPTVHTRPMPSAPPQPGAGAAQRKAAERREPVAHGPRITVAGVTATGFAHRPVHRLVRSAQPPEEQAPAGDPTGVYGDEPAADGGTTGHSDGHAVALNHRAPLPLVRGATAVRTADGTRDRHRDIPEFPG